jgi:hypothetical protein
MTEPQIETIENYFFIVQTITERANNEFTEAIKQVCKDAMNYMWQFHDEDE